MRRTPFGVYWPALDLALFVTRGEAVWLWNRRVLGWLTPAKC